MTDTINDSRESTGIHAASETVDIEDIRWFHSVPLRDGRTTNGVVDAPALEPNYLFDRLDFRGRSVLDIGCWDGYFSFMAEQRGAKSVVGLDDPRFRWGGLAGFNYLKAHFESQVEWRRGTVYDLPKERFDIVLCYGVLYHINDPFTAATNCFQAANERVVFEGQIFDCEAPLSILLQPGAIANDPSNMYCVSTGYLDQVAAMNGYVREMTKPSPWNAEDQSLNRHSVAYRRIDECKPGFPASCFSVPPTCLQDDD